MTDIINMVKKENFCDEFQQDLNYLTTQTTSTSNIQDEAGSPLRQFQKFDGTLGDFPLDANHAARRIVFSSLLGIVEKRSVTGEFWPRHVFSYDDREEGGLERL